MGKTLRKHSEESFCVARPNGLKCVSGRTWQKPYVHCCSRMGLWIGLLVNLGF
jgi:hypothetical protein